MHKMADLPPKIKNLYLLKKQGFSVPPFLVLQKEDVDDISAKLIGIKQFFQEKGTKSVIIRSANQFEDGEEKSMAGFFESSTEIPLPELSAAVMIDLWKKNSHKLADIEKEGLWMFVQAYFSADLSGVLFTQSPYDESEAKLLLSSKAHVVTDGKSPEKSLLFCKKEKKWKQDGQLDVARQKKLADIISKAEELFPSGADIELGLKGAEVGVYQIRPLTRSADEKILLEEKKRLQKTFGKFFAEQLWERNAFVQALGDLDKTSLDFYEKLLNSEQLQAILVEAKIIQAQRGVKKGNILENIGGRIFFNVTQEKILFTKAEGKRAEFFRLVAMLSHERIIKDKIRIENSQTYVKDEVCVIGNSFSAFFVSGIYFSFFLEQDRKKYGMYFLSRLENTEVFCGALEPRPKSLAREDLQEFKKEYFYLGENPYQLGSHRLGGMAIEEMEKKYATLAGESKKADTNKLLSKKTIFWLQMRVAWKEFFLQALADSSAREKDSCGFFQPVNKIKNVPFQISGSNFPFPLQDVSDEAEKIISPGDIDDESAVVANEDDEVEKYFGKVIRMTSFPVDWITHIPKFKGIILAEGNELSHMAITCREYGVPCKISYVETFAIPTNMVL